MFSPRRVTHSTPGRHCPVSSHFLDRTVRVSGRTEPALFGRRPDQPSIIRPTLPAASETHVIFSDFKGFGFANSQIEERLVHHHRNAQSGVALYVAIHLLRDKESSSTFRSTIDGWVQEAALDILHRHILDNQRHNVEDRAGLVVQNATGAVLAYVRNSGD